METVLLGTKLSFPQARALLVRRPRLRERLSAGLQGPLTLIAAPAGFGKSTLLAEFGTQTLGEPVPHGCALAWLSLDVHDNDAARFFTYVLAALAKFAPEWTEEAARLLSLPDLPPLDTILTTLINAASASPRELALILDDYQVIENPAIHQALTFLLEHVPPHLHLVLLTRADPPFPLARLRARGQLTEIRAEHLRFTFEEAAAFLSQVMGLQLPDEAITALQSRTEGWIAGLQLAGLSLQGCSDPESFIEAFKGSHHYVADYLLDEVLNRQSESVREFLLHTSILERLNAPLCDAVLGTAGEASASTLQSLERNNLFLIPLDEDHRWFRYHHLFADLLRQRLRQIAAARIPELHRRAAAWFEAAGLTPEALDHALAGQDAIAVLRLLRNHVAILMSTQSRERILGWLDRLPPGFLHAEPWLCVLYAWTVWSQGKLKLTETYLDYAQSAWERLEAIGQVPSGDSEYEGLPAEILAFRALITTQKHASNEVRRLAGAALKQAPATASVVRAIAYTALNVAYRDEGDVENAIAACRAGLQEAQKGNDAGTTMSVFHSLGKNLTLQGRLREAAEVYREALDYARAHGEARCPGYAVMRLQLADLLYLWNALDEANAELQLGLEVANLTHSVWGMVFGRYVLSRIQWAKGERDAARHTVAEMQSLLAQTPDLYYVDELRRLLVLVEAECELPPRSTMDTPPGFLALTEASTTNELECAIGQIYQRVALNHFEFLQQPLERALTLTEARGHGFWLLRLTILQTVLEERQGRHQQAEAALMNALSLAAPQAIVRPFLDDFERLRPILVRILSASQHATATIFARHLLTLSTPDDRTPPVFPQSLIAPLSRRELELLALIAEGHSNKEIARALYISLGTVKRHTANIFTKLDVQNRTEAVAKARVLGLLP